MKKLISLSLALLLMLSLCACNLLYANKADISALESTVSDASSKEESSSAAAPSSSKEEALFERGTVTGNTYENGFMGVSFAAPEGFRFYTDDEIAQVYSLSAETFKIDASTTVIYDMYCTNDTTGTSININYENLLPLYGALPDVEDYLKTNSEALETMFNSTDGMAVKSIEVSTAETADGTLHCLQLELDINGMAFYETIAVKEANGYMMIFTVGSFQQEEITSVLKSLSAE